MINIKEKEIKSGFNKDQNEEKIEILKDRLFLIEEKVIITVEELKRRFPIGKIAVCDFYVYGAEKGKINKNNILYEDILNFDHHAPIEEVRKFISSTNFAIDYVRESGLLPKDYRIIINHTDCDSVLSSAILIGILEANDIFGKAAIAADHTGEENPIADLLQAIENQRDYNFSIKNLKLLLEGKSLELKAEKLLQKRRDERKQIKELVENNKFEYLKLKNNLNIAWIILNNKIDSGLLPALLPDSLVIVLASLMPKGSLKKWEIKVRLGIKSEGISLNNIGLPDFGGRWNAGSTKRSGGTNIDPKDFVEIIKTKIEGII